MCPSVPRGARTSTTHRRAPRSRSLAAIAVNGSITADQAAGDGEIAAPLQVRDVAYAGLERENDGQEEERDRDHREAVPLASVYDGARRPARAIRSKASTTDSDRPGRPFW